MSKTEKAKVYFTDFHTIAFGDGLPAKLKKLIRKAGIGSIDMDGKFVAIKMHFGELGNISYLRPNYAKAVVDVIKELGGKPFLTDCNTMYPGSRKNALEHLECAWENGFTPLTVGCPIIIGDGLKGTDDIAVPVAGGEYIKEANNPQSTRFQELNTFLDSIQQTIEKQKEAFLQKNATTYVALNHIAQNADRMNLKELTERYELFPAELQNSLLGQQIKTQIKKMQTLAPGQIAPDFTVQTPDGKSFNLHSIKAKAKIIDFWASWCAPCRALTPQLVKLYNEFHEQGLEIIGISLDDKKEAWIKAIEEENIPWFQGSKLDGFKPDNPLNQLYGIHGIPHIVLLNTDNQIVVTTTDIKILREEILKLFKQ